MVDRPATPEEKVLAMFQIADREGREFDEVKIRRIYGAPPVPADRQPISRPASSERAELISLEEQAARREDEVLRKAAEAQLLKEAEAAAGSDVLLQLRRALERNAALEAQLSERTGAAFPPQPQAPEVPAPGSSAPVVVASTEGAVPEDERPNRNWSASALKAYAAEHGIVIPRNGVAMSATAILEVVITALDAGTEPQVADFQEVELSHV